MGDYSTKHGGQNPRIKWQRAPLRMLFIVLTSVTAGYCGVVVFLLAYGEPLGQAIIPVAGLRMESKVDANHPLIVKWANRIRMISSSPLQQVAEAEQLVVHEVAYTQSSDVWGHEYTPNLDEIVGRSAANEWPTLRGNCVAQAIALCSLYRALGYDAHIRNTASHAWVRVSVGKQTLDALRVQEETSLDGYLGHRAKPAPTVQLPAGQSVYFAQPLWLVLLPVAVFAPFYLAARKLSRNGQTSDVVQVPRKGWPTGKTNETPKILLAAIPVNSTERWHR